MLNVVAVLHRIAIGGLVVITALYAFQKPFREYPGLEYEQIPHSPGLPGKDRVGLRPPDVSAGGPLLRRRGIPRQLEGGRHPTGPWIIRARDRHLSQAVRRLTRIHARSVEEPIDLDDGDVYDWPWLYGVEVGHWNLTDAPGAGPCANTCCAAASSCATISTATSNGTSSSASMRKVFPDRPIVEIPNGDAIFHTIYDLDDRYQVPGALYLETRP